MSSLKDTLCKNVAFQKNALEDFVNHWHQLEISKGEFISKEGKIENYFYYVEKGVLRAYFIKDGQDKSVGFTYDGDYSGAYDSLITGKPSQFYMEALTNCKLYRISKQDLNLMYDKHKDVERWGRLFNQEILFKKGFHEINVLSYTAEERFERLLRESPHMIQLVPQKHLASYLGMSAETFSRLRKKIKL